MSTVLKVPPELTVVLHEAIILDATKFYSVILRRYEREDGRKYLY